MSLKRRVYRLEENLRSKENETRFVLIRVLCFKCKLHKGQHFKGKIYQKCSLAESLQLSRNFQKIH